MLKIFWKFGESKWNPYWIIMLINSSGTSYAIVVSAMIIVDESYPSWASSWVYINFINHYKKFQFSVANLALAGQWGFPEPGLRSITELKLELLSIPIPIGKTPVRIILWYPITKMLIKACFLIQPLEQEGGCQKCCMSLCSKVFINHFYQMKENPECLNILTYWRKYWVDTLRRTLRRKF